MRVLMILAAGLALSHAAAAAPAVPPGALPPGIALAPPSIHDPATLTPGAAMPADAILPGAPGVGQIVCVSDTDPARTVAVLHPWSAAPLLIGPSGPRPARFFKRGRTLIFDAGREVIYIDRDRRHATYSRTTRQGVETLRGSCQARG